MAERWLRFDTQNLFTSSGKIRTGAPQSAAYRDAVRRARKQFLGG